MRLAPQLAYLRQYFEFYVAFNRLDTSVDNRLDMAEFRNSLDTLDKWGIKLTPEQAEVEFKHIDVNGGGFILFDEVRTPPLQRHSTHR